MSWEDENIDKLFQDASANSKFEFKEEYWTEMEAMLPKKKKRRMPIIWAFSALTGCAIIAVMFFSIEDHNSVVENNLKENKIDKATVSNNNKISTHQSNAKIETENSLISKTTITTTNQHKSILKRKQNSNSILNSINNSLKEKTELNLVKNEIENSNTTALAQTLVKSDEEISKNEVNYLASLPFPSNSLDHNLMPSEIFKSRIKKWMMYFDANTSMGQSMIRSNSTGSNLTKGFGIATGVSYSTKTWTFSAGISTTFSSYDNLLIRERVKVYGFGMKSYENNISYNQLYTFETPLMIGLKQKNHIIQFGVVPTYLIGSRMSFESKENNQIYSSSTLYGYSKGLINFGLKPTIGYIYKITPSLQIGGNIQLQLFSQIETNVFEGTKNSLPLNGQFFIRKTIFIKR